MTEVLKAGVLSDEIDLGALAHNAAEQAEEFVRKVPIRYKSVFLYYRLTNCFLFKILTTFLRFGKHRGSSVISGTFQSGYKIMISYMLATDHLYHLFTPVLKVFFEFIQKLEIFGLICLVRFTAYS